MDYKDKIRKLLALAKSPEPEEAKFALLKARKLMAEHKLSERDLEERNTTVIKRAIRETFSKKANSWMDPLSIVIGENYCCSAFRCKISAKTTVWHVGFIGLEGDIEICVKIFRYAVRCIKSEQKKLRKQHRDYYTPQEIAKICDSYGYGFARGVYEAFTRQNEENQEYGLVLKVPNHYAGGGAPCGKHLTASFRRLFAAFSSLSTMWSGSRDTSSPGGCASSSGAQHRQTHRRTSSGASSPS